MKRIALIASCLIGTAVAAEDNGRLNEFTGITSDLTCTIGIAVMQNDSRVSNGLHALVWGMVAGAASSKVTDEFPFEASMAGMNAIVIAGCLINQNAKLIDVLNGRIER